MSPSVKPIPDGHDGVSPYLFIAGAAKAIDFYIKVFKAVELFHMPGPDGKIMHAELRIGHSVVMLADEFPEMGAKGPAAYGGSPVMLHLYVADVDATIAGAVAAGGNQTRPVQDQFYGDRTGMFVDPFGYTWYVATHKEDLTPEEMKRRHDAMEKPPC